MRFLVVGAGVIGQVYAGRLSTAGHDVTVVARGTTFERLSDRGIRLVTGGVTTSCPVRVVAAPPSDDFDCVVLAVRFDQIDSAIEGLEGVVAEQVITLGNLPEESDQLLTRWGRDRTVLAFAGVGGFRDDDGCVHYTEVRQQHSTVGRNSGTEEPFAQALRDAGFVVDVEDDMPAWLTTHAVFITAVGAAILIAGGDSRVLGRDRHSTAAMVAAVGEGFRALQLHGIRPVPTPLRTIFTIVPKIIAVPYWQRQLRGPTGVESITPHVVASRDTEFPALTAAVRRILGSSAPRLDSLLTAAGV